MDLERGGEDYRRMVARETSSSRMGQPRFHAMMDFTITEITTQAFPRRQLSRFVQPDQKCFAPVPTESFRLPFVQLPLYDINAQDRADRHPGRANTASSRPARASRWRIRAVAS